MIEILYDDKTLTYCIPQTNYFNLKINGSYVNKGSGYTTRFLTKIKPETITYEKGIEKLIHYKKEDKIITLKEVNNLKPANVYVNGEWLDEEAEVRYAIFMRNSEPVYKKIVEEKEVNFKIKKCPVSEYEEIRLVCLVDQSENVDKSIFRLHLNLNKHFLDIMEEVKSKIPNCNYTKKDNGYYLEFAKINGSYVFKSIQRNFFNQYLNFKGSYEECVIARNNIVKYIKDIIYNFLNKSNSTSITQGQFLHRITEIRRDVESLSTTTLDLKYSILQELIKLQKNLEILND